MDKEAAARAGDATAMTSAIERAREFCKSRLRKDPSTVVDDLAALLTDIRLEALEEAAIELEKCDCTVCHNRAEIVRKLKTKNATLEAERRKAP